MKKNLLFLLLFSFVSVAIAQENTDEKPENEEPKPWKISGMLQINMSQVYLDNWVAGGESSYSGMGLFKLSADYKKNKTTWDNDFELAHGQMVQGQDEARKTDDRLNFSSTFGYNLSGKFYYSGNLTMKTQLFNGYEYPDKTVEVSSAFAPAEFLYSVGVQYKPNKDFNILFSPLTGKTTLVANDYLSELGAFGVEPGEKTYSNFGAYLKLKYKTEVIKNVTFTTNYDMFGDYKDLKVWDINWEVSIEMKVNDWLSTNIMTHLIYNQDISTKTQFKEVLGLGVGVKF